MAKRTKTPQPSGFPHPHEWATWTKERWPQFKSHSTLAFAKAAITNSVNQIRDGEWWIYRYVDGQWEEYLYLPSGGDRSHELWTSIQHTATPRKVSDRAVNKAIESIMKAAK